MTRLRLFVVAWPKNVIYLVDARIVATRRSLEERDRYWPLLPPHKSCALRDTLCESCALRDAPSNTLVCWVETRHHGKPHRHKK